MIDFGYSRGHLVYCVNGVTYYADGTIDDESRPCPKCHKTAGPNEPDPCLGWLENVDYACCGHGVPGEEFVMSKGVRYESVREWHDAHDTLC